MMNMKKNVTINGINYRLWETSTFPTALSYPS